MKSITSRFIIGVSLLFIAEGVFSSCPASTQNEKPEGDVFKCETECELKKNASSQFTSLVDLAVTYDNKLCKSLLRIDEDTSASTQLLLKYSQEAENIMLDSFTNSSVDTAIAKQFDHFDEKVMDFKGPIQLNTLPKMQTSAGNNVLYLSDPGLGEGSVITDAASADCKSAAGGSFGNCFLALDDVSNAFNVYRVSVSNYQPFVNSPQLARMNTQWDKYLSDARSQTFLDVWFTTVIHDDYYSKDYLVSPRSSQYFLLRPQVVYEFNNDAKNGDRNQLGLAAEWIGVNFWDWKIPFGVSAISVYADYEEEDSVGHGLLFTVNNSASIGFVRRGDSDGIFVTMDFLKLWQDKSKTLEEYKQDPFAWLP